MAEKGGKEQCLFSGYITIGQAMTLSFLGIFSPNDAKNDDCLERNQQLFCFLTEQLCFLPSFLLWLCNVFFQCV